MKPRFISLKEIHAPPDVSKMIATLNSMGRKRLGTQGAGPFLPGDDFVKAKEIVQRADEDLLKQLLLSENPQVRANIARAISAIRPQNIPMLNVLLNDSTPIKIQGTNDLPPNPDQETTIKALVSSLTQNASATVGRADLTNILRVANQRTLTRESIESTLGIKFKAKSNRARPAANQAIYGDIVFIDPPNEGEPTNPGGSLHVEFASPIDKKLALEIAAKDFGSAIEARNERTGFVAPCGKIWFIHDSPDGNVTSAELGFLRIVHNL